MKPLFSGIKKEWMLIMRNGISRYMVFAPVIMAIVFTIVFGAMRESNLTIAIDNTISEPERMQLEQVFDVEAFASPHQMNARVEGVDSVAGVTKVSGEIFVIVEGNEGAKFISSMQAMVGHALQAKPIVFTSKAIAGKGDIAFQLSLIGVYLLSLFIGGSTVGLTSVGERESGVVRAIIVSPITLVRFTFGKLIPAVAIGTIGTILVTLITGNAQVLLMMTVLSLAGIFVCGISAFIIPAFANNQIAAVGVLKLSMPLMLVLPLSSMFVPEKWQVFYFWMPMYWQYRSIEQILSGSDALLSIMLSFIVAIPWFVLIVTYFSKKISMNRR